MARSKKTEGVGHNSDLTEDDIAALQLWFSNQIRQARKKADAAKAAYDLEREAVNGLFSQARGELKITRKEFEEILALQDMTETDFLDHEAKRTARMRAQGLPVGEQMSLALGDTADDKANAFNDGFRAGLRGDDPEIPERVHPVCHQDWLKGWGDGQAKLAEGLNKGAEVMDRISAAKKAAAVELEPDEDPEPEDEEEALDDAARKLKRDGWAEPTPAETEMEPA